MKRLLTLLILYSTIAIQYFFAQALDVNGVALPASAQGSIFLQQPASLLMATSYDSVRALNEINITGQADAYPWLSADALRLYYTKGQPGNYRYMFTSRPDTASFFSSPVVLDSLLPTTSSTTSCWLSPDELDFYFISTSQLFYCHRNSITAPLSTPLAITLAGCPGSPGYSPSFDSTQNELFIWLGSIGIGRFLRTSTTSFSFNSMVNLPPIFTPGPAQLSKDGLTMFLTGTTATNLIYETSRPDTASPFGPVQLVQGINDTITSFNSQPSMSNNLTWVAFTRAVTNNWTENDLYIAHKGQTATPVFAPADKAIFTIFPNPFTDEFTVSIPMLRDKFPVDIKMFDVFGKQVLSQKLSTAPCLLPTSKLPAGVYFVKVNSEVKKIIKIK